MERVLLTDDGVLEGPREVARAWNGKLLTPGFRPPAGAEFCALPRTGEDDCDRLRICYLVATNQVIVTQTLCMFSIQIRDERWNGSVPSNINDVERLAREVFQGATALRLRDDGDSAEHRGVALPDTGIPWSKRFNWKQHEGMISFWLFKDDGHPRMAACGPTLQGNAHWFSGGDRLKKR